MTAEARPLLATILLALGGCGGDLELPPLVARGEYIAFHTDADADASVVCMDDKLAREDRFIERTALLLGVDPPSNTIDYVWDPSRDGSEPWACPPRTDCYQHRPGDDDLQLIVSKNISNHHELVHAIEVQALGSGNQLLEEGLAEYLGTLNTSLFKPENFPGDFKKMLAVGPEDTRDYRLAMHFVGTIFALHGATKYRALRARMPKDAGPEAFAEVFEAEYGQSLDDALVEMSGEQVYALDVVDGCEEGEAPELAWTSERVLDTQIESTCGDPGFHGAGFVDGRPGFFGHYIIEVPVAGYYELTVSGVPGGSSPLRAMVVSCFRSLVATGVGAPNGKTDRGPLQPGRNLLVIQFPPSSQARGEARIRLELDAPPP